MSFANPLWLQIGAGLVVLVGVGALSRWWRRRRLAGFLGGRVAAGRLSRSNLYRWPWERVLLLGIAVMATASAVAGPVWDVAPAPPAPPPPVRNFLIALDISASMQATDVAPNRLAQAVATVDDLLTALEDDRVGLLLFAGRSYPLGPPTEDHRALRYLLSGVTPTIASAHDPGSLPSVALTEAVNMLDRWAPADDERTIVLISDGEAGEDPSGMEAAGRAAVALGVTVHTVGVGTSEGSSMVMPSAPYQLGGRIMDQGGAPAISRLREPNLALVADAGSGVYAAVDDVAAMTRLRAALTAPTVSAVPPDPLEDAPAWTRWDPIFGLAAVALMAIVLESLLDIRMPKRALAPMRRPA
ncbi:MAG: VWA domain-containing protein [Gemmatimonas sp.]|nr:VWA domain-containing protein [Gemmatimonas sp.]